MIQVNRIYLIFNRLVTKKFLVDTSDLKNKTSITYSENFKIQFLPLPNLPIYSKHLAYEKNLFSILLPNN